MKLLVVFCILFGIGSSHSADKGKDSKARKAPAASKTETKADAVRMSCLNSLPNHGVNYFKPQSDGAHIVFITNTDNMTIKPKSPHGFFYITRGEVQFCELNLPRASNVEFEYAGEVVRRNNGPRGVKPSKLGTPTKCVDGKEDAPHRVENYLYGPIESDAINSNLSRAELEAKYKDCLDLPRAREIIGRGLSLRKPAAASDANTGNADGE